MKEQQINRLEINNNVNNNIVNIINKNKPIRFKFNNKQYIGYEGDTLASALLANNITLVGRSYKYGRYRGIVTAGVEEPNAIVELESGGYYVPNIKATEVYLYNNLEAKSATGRPYLQYDFKYALRFLNKFLSAGFYYKTFKWPSKFWLFYEKLLRSAAGLSKAPDTIDNETYEHQNHFYDVVIIGGGISGLQAAYKLAKQGHKICILEQDKYLGGNYHLADFDINSEDNNFSNHIIDINNIIISLKKLSNVNIYTRTTAYALHDNNLVKAQQNLTLDISINDRKNTKTSKILPSKILHSIYAKQVVLATGAIERILAFKNNDLPNIMLASAVSSYIVKHSVVPGRNIVLFTNNDSGYNLISNLQYLLNNKQVNLTIVDVRDNINNNLKEKIKNYNIKLLLGYTIVSAYGRDKVKSLKIQKISQKPNKNFTSVQKWELLEKNFTISADLVAIAGGWNPVIHLGCHSGDKPIWSDELLTFVLNNNNNRVSVGSAAGYYTTEDCLLSVNKVLSNKLNNNLINSINIVNFFRTPGSYNKQFIDMQNDVTANDINIAIDENFTNIEHIKRYTALGFGTDQGKIGNITGVAVCSEILNKPIKDISTTTFRPAYTPVTFGTLAGDKVKDNFDLERYTPIHQWHKEHNALFEVVGQWQRAWYYPKSNESFIDAVNREAMAARTSVAMIDASTLGKIDIQGPDAREFLNRVLPNSWSKIKTNACRYYIFMHDDGMVFDDGVTACLGDNHFYMMTTTSNAAASFNKLEKLLQVDWPNLKVYLTSVTDHWSTTAVVGRKSRKVLQKLCHDIDFSNDAFPFMQVRHGSINNIDIMVMRISFSGELAYEVNVQSNYGKYIWQEIYNAGQEFNITPYGTEVLHVLRAEKGYPIIGQDTDGSVSGADLGMSWMFAKKKAYSYLGKRAHKLDFLTMQNRKQYVGLISLDKKSQIPEGSQIIVNTKSKKSIGHVTSSYYSPILGYPIALALIENGFNNMGDTVYAFSHKCNLIAAEICSTVFYDKQGEMQNVS